jgi:predicted Rossmann fold nucleotide-binding protein DprA/Smf involved in DNA uptake
MNTSPDTNRAALLLTNRLVRLETKPLTAREFWSLANRSDPGRLMQESAATIAEIADVDLAEAERLRALLDASTALSFEQERLLDGGISLLSAFDDHFPSALRVRLRDACPTFLLVAGPVEWLSRAGLAVVGSRNADEAVLDAARQSAELAVRHGWPVVSGLARGVDQVAMAGALDADGIVVGVPAEGILRVSKNADVRRRVHSGTLCIASPFGPNAPFQAGNAMGRNKIIYALSRLAFVVASDQGTGGTWAGAREALDRRYAPVAVWTGAGAKDGNEALVRRGAHPVSDIVQLFEIDEPDVSPPLQESLF